MVLVDYLSVEVPFIFGNLSELLSEAEQYDHVSVPKLVGEFTRNMEDTHPRNNH